MSVCWISPETKERHLGDSEVFALRAVAVVGVVDLHGLRLPMEECFLA